VWCLKWVERNPIHLIIKCCMMCLSYERDGGREREREMMAHIHTTTTTTTLSLSVYNNIYASTIPKILINVCVYCITHLTSLVCGCWLVGVLSLSLSLSLSTKYAASFIICIHAHYYCYVCVCVCTVPRMYPSPVQVCDKLNVSNKTC
jgi:hypothetical protein